MVCCLCLVVDPLGDSGAAGVKGKTWGPSTMQRDRVQRSSSLVMADTARHSKSAPNLDKTLRHLGGGGHSNIGALQEMGEFLSTYPNPNPFSKTLRHPGHVEHKTQDNSQTREFLSLYKEKNEKVFS